MKISKDMIVRSTAPTSANELLLLPLTTSMFPNALKIAKVLPIYKGGDRDITSNYRPISILPHFSKILEKILKHNLIDYISK